MKYLRHKCDFKRDEDWKFHESVHHCNGKTNLFHVKKIIAKFIVKLSNFVVSTWATVVAND